MVYEKEYNRAGQDKEPRDPFDLAIEFLLGLMLVFMPLALGAVQAWSKEVVLALVAAMSVVMTIKLVARPQTRWVRSWAILPPLLFLGVGLLQIIPLPARVVELLSPRTAAIVQELLADLPAQQAAQDRMTISLYPHATRHDLRLVLGAAAVFAIVLNVVRTPAQIKRLLTVVAITGAAVAALAIAQVVTRTDKIYWFVPIISARAGSGTFVNHSNFAQFMNLSIGAALALLLVQVSETFDRRWTTAAQVLDYITSPQAKRIWLWSGAAVLGAASIFVCLSRGGIIAMLIAFSFSMVLLAIRRPAQGRGKLMAFIAVAAFACVLYIGFDAVYERLASLDDLNKAQGGRWQIVQDIALAWTRFPLLGTGLGTHAMVYPMFDRSTIPALAAHAENEYAQALEETGLAGFLGLAALCLVVWTAFARTVRRGRSTIDMAAYGLGFGLLAIMVQSLSDFGQHLPPNFMLSAVFCALLLVLARRKTAQSGKRQAASVAHSALALRIAVLVANAGVWVWVLIAAHNASVAEAHWNQAIDLEQVLTDRQWQGTDREYADLIGLADSAVRAQPDDVEYRYWRAAYRWRSISRVNDPNTGQVVLVPQALDFAGRIIGELNQARAVCPCYGPVYCLAGQLERLTSNEALGVGHIRTGYRLAPCDPTVCLVAGMLDVEQGCMQDGVAKLSRAVQLSGRLFTEVAGFYIYDLSRPDLAVDLAADNIGRLTQVANLLANLEEAKELSDQVRSRVVDLLQQRADQPDAPAGVFAALAGMYQRHKDAQAAIRNYQKALVIDYANTGWRYALAMLLADQGETAKAMEEARICLRFRPDHAAAKQLIARLSVQPVSASGALAP